MPTAYNSAPTIDRPYAPGEFVRYAETTGTGVVDQAEYMAPQTPEANYSSHPELQAEAARQYASDLAMPAGDYSNDQFQVPQSAEVSEYEARIQAEAAAETLRGGVENMLSHSDRELSAAEIDARFDAIAANEHAREQQDMMAPHPEARYGTNGAVLEAYHAGCAAMSVRRLYLQEAGANLN